MTKTEGRSASAAVKDILLSNPDGLRDVIRAVMQEVLEAEMDEALGAHKGERTPERLGYRSGHYGRTLITRVGKLELRVPQDRAGRFSTELFERYQRSERALVATLAEMYVQGVSTRKVKAITEELCGHAFSASSISAINKRLDESLAAFAGRPLQEPFPYLIVDARYEKVREAGVVMSQAVLIAVGIDWDGRRQILNFALPGDFIGLQASIFDSIGNSVEALSDVVLCVFPREKLWDLYTRYPTLAFDVTWLAAREEQILDEHLLSVGRRTEQHPKTQNSQSNLE